MKNSNLELIRKIMNKEKIDAYIIPSTDPHQSEYLPDQWKRRAFFSGFDGSAGEVAVTHNSAALWTDSRYFLQGEIQLKESGIELQKIGLPETLSMTQWLIEQLGPGSKVGIDPQLIDYSNFQNVYSDLKSMQIELISIEDNLVDPIWNDQPEFPKTAIKIHPLKYAGKSSAEKINDLRSEMTKSDTSAHVISVLDAIAWLFNIRGKDVEFNPFVISYAIITHKESKLFVHSDQINESIKENLHNDNIDIFPYSDFKKHLQVLKEDDKKIWLDPDTASQWIVDILLGEPGIFYKESPITLAKAQKNEKELKGIEAAHIRDGVAMVKFLKWLEENLGKIEITEISASDKLAAFRSEQDLFVGLSFDSISGYKEHGAIVHYSSTPETDVPLINDGIYLIDSGGQYLDGTTDITRTLALGEPTTEQKDRFTRVLKGHIALAKVRFPIGTTGPALDTLARLPLWETGLNYGHGTGHGVGAYLGVHEGPQGISYYRGQGVPILEGMFTSNEPGFYKEGEYGIRIENLIVAVQDKESNSNFLKFDTVTYCPIDMTLIDKNLLNKEEIDWLNEYHQTVWKKLSPRLVDEEKDWLKKATKKIQ